MTQALASVDFNGPVPPSRSDVGPTGAARSANSGLANSGLASTRLACTRLTLSNFRCYEHARLETGPKPIVLSGANGAGKTNVLEALSFLVPGSGLRRAKLSDVGRRDPGVRDSGADAGRVWAVAAEVSSGDYPVRIGTGLENVSGAKRVVHIDGEAQRAQSVLSAHFAVHWLTPQMDRLFLDGSVERRRFLDRLVYSFDPAHAGRISAYNHALRERTKLLADNKMDDAWLSALEDTLATRGMAVAAARLHVAERLAGGMAGVFHETDSQFPACTLAIDGLAEGWLTDLPALEVEDRLRRALKSSRSRDAKMGGAGNAIEGRLPHQSDLVVTHAAKAMPAGQCSTGEQKMLLVGLVLAAARLSASDEGRVPVLLLDEVAAHLDAHHRDALFGEVLSLGCQAWFTGTESDLFAPLQGRAHFFTVNDATVSETS